jgi:prepilin-type N-terminal cleavage/methylation domain-containing protein
MKQKGFTLVELALVVAIVGILGATAVNAYRQSVVRAQLAQQLVDVGHIRRVVEIESRNGHGDLQDGTSPGHAPAGLNGLVPDREFSGLEGLRLQLVHVPAIAVRSESGSEGYGLIADTTGNVDRLRLFHHEIQRAGFEPTWLGPSSFLFLLGVASDEGGGQPGSGGATGSGGGAAGGGAPAPAGAGDGPGPGTGAGSGPPPTTCGPGYTQAGNSGNCRPDKDKGKGNDR